MTTTPGQLLPAAKIVTSTILALDRDVYRASHITLNSSYQRRSAHLQTIEPIHCHQVRIPLTNM